MAWIESHQSLEEHPKLVRICALTNWNQDEAIGKLMRLWWWALQYAEDGDLSRFSPDQYLSRLDKNIPPDTLLEHLKAAYLITKNGLIHDWVDYAGKYLIKKYSSHYKKKLKMIWAKHGRKYGQTQEHTKRGDWRPNGDLKATLHNLTLPNLTKPKEHPPTPQGFESFWSSYPKRKSKGQAEKAWRAIAPNEQLQDRILRAVEQAKTSAEWLRDGGRFIPYPATWLNAKGWEDEGGGPSNLTGAAAILARMEAKNARHA